MGWVTSNANGERAIPIAESDTSLWVSVAKIIEMQPASLEMLAPIKGRDICFIIITLCINYMVYTSSCMAERTNCKIIPKPVNQQIESVKTLIKK